MKPNRILLTALLTVLSLGIASLSSVGCGGSGAGTGTAAVTIRVGGDGPAAGSAPPASSVLPRAVPTSVTRMTFTISGPGMETIVRTVATAGRTVVVETFNVPKGLQRTFVIEAFDAAGVLRYRGSATVDVVTDVLSVPITMAIAGANPAFGRWTWRNPVPAADPLDGVAFGNGAFVAVGGPTAAVSTTNGATWTARAAGASPLRAVAFDGGVFVAVGAGGVIARSLDGGVSWGTVPSGVTFNLRDVAGGGGAFVAVGDNGTVLSSADGGASWTARASGTAEEVSHAAFGSGTFVVTGNVSATGVGFVLRSTNGGASWSPAGTLPVGISQIGPVAFGNGRFVAPAGVQGAQPIISTDGGVTWTESSMLVGIHEGIAFGNAAFVVVDAAGTILVANDNGTGWTQATSFTTNPLTGVAFGNGVFVAVASTGEIGTSTTGATWTAVGSPRVDAAFLGVASGNGLAVAVGNSPFALAFVPPSVAYYSADGGATWSPGASNTTVTMRRAAFGNNVFIAVGGGGTIRTSASGVSWAGAGSGTANDLSGVAFGNGTFVAVGDNGAVTRSTDGGATWNAIQLSGFPALASVAFGNGAFVAAGSVPGGGGGGVWRSSDSGATWTQSAGSPTGISAVAFGAGVFLATSSTSGATFVSLDNGATWTAAGTIPVGLRTFVMSVAYGGGAFAAVSSNGTVAISTDQGATWTSLPVAQRVLADIAFVNGTFVVVGDQLSILQSDPL